MLVPIVHVVFIYLLFNGNIIFKCFHITPFRLWSSRYSHRHKLSGSTVFVFLFFYYPVFSCMFVVFYYSAYELPNRYISCHSRRSSINHMLVNLSCFFFFNHKTTVNWSLRQDKSSSHPQLPVTLTPSDHLHPLMSFHRPYCLHLPPTSQEPSLSWQSFQAVRHCIIHCQRGCGAEINHGASNAVL